MDHTDGGDILAFVLQFLRDNLRSHGITKIVAYVNPQFIPTRMHDKQLAERVVDFQAYKYNAGMNQVS